jgi:hypothetical protein
MLASPDHTLPDVASTTVMAFIAGRLDLRLDLLRACSGPLVVIELRRLRN